MQCPKGKGRRFIGSARSFCTKRDYISDYSWTPTGLGRDSEMEKKKKLYANARGCSAIVILVWVSNIAYGRVSGIRKMAEVGARSDNFAEAVVHIVRACIPVLA